MRKMVFIRSNCFSTMCNFSTQRPACVFFDIPALPSIPGFEDIPKTELLLYRQLARHFSTHLPDAQWSLEDIKTEFGAVHDFWKCNLNTLPLMSKLATKHAFLVGSSACVERAFSYYSKILSDERTSLDENNLRMLMFLYFNSGKLT